MSLDPSTFFSFGPKALSIFGFLLLGWSLNVLLNAMNARQSIQAAVQRIFWPLLTGTLMVCAPLAFSSVAADAAFLDSFGGWSALRGWPLALGATLAAIQLAGGLSLALGLRRLSMSRSLPQPTIGAPIALIFAGVAGIGAMFTVKVLSLTIGLQDGLCLLSQAFCA